MERDPRHGVGWPDRPSLSEADLLRGYGIRPPGETMTGSQAAATGPDARLRPTGPRDPRAALVDGLRVGGRDARPVRVVIHAPSVEAVAPWLNWLRGRGLHVHVIGRAAYAHHPDRRELGGWLVGFDVVGEPRPSWLRWLTTQESRIRTPRDRAADLVIRRLEERVR